MYVTGGPELALQVGERRRLAEYARGTGSERLVFAWTVQADDEDRDGVSVAAGYLDTAHGGVADAAGNATYVSHDGLAADAAHRVGDFPRVTGVQMRGGPANGHTYVAGEEILVVVNFTEVANYSHGAKATLPLRIGATELALHPYAGNGYRQFWFRRTVREGDYDGDGIEVPANGLSGTIYRQGYSGDLFDLGHAALAPGLKVDGIAPAVTEASIVSRPASGNTYRLGESIEVAVSFNEPVLVDATGGTPTVRLTLASGDRLAGYRFGSGAHTLRFAYEVQATDVDNDGIEIRSQTGDGPAPIVANGATIRDLSGVDASLGLPDSIDSDHGVRGTEPTTGSQPSVGDDIVVWKATLTVGSLGDDALGWSDGDDAGGALSPSTFVFSGTGYRVTRIQAKSIASDTGVELFITTDPGLSAPYDGFPTWHLGARTFGHSSRYRFPFGGRTVWHDTPPLNWEEDDTVEVRLTAPLTRVTGLALTSAPATGDTYGEGETVTAAVTFNRGVGVDRDAGSPTLTLDVGGARAAAYAGGSGSDTLTFAWTVGADDLDDDGIAIGANALALNGSLITYGSVEAALGHAALGAQAGHLVDGLANTVPEVTLSGVDVLSTPGSDGVYQRGDAIELRLRYGGTVHLPPSAAPALTLDVGGVARHAQFAGVSGLAALTFVYLVQAGDHDTDGVAVAAGRLVLPPGTALRDDYGRVVAPALAARTFAGHVVDGRGANAVAIGSTPANGSDYRAGETITVTAAFGEPVTVAGTPSIGLQVGGSVRRARYTGGSGSATLGFGYQVQAGDRDGDGVSVPADSLAADGGALRDGDGGDLPLVNPELPAQAAHRVGRPAVTGLEIRSQPGAAGAYAAGEGIRVRVTFSESVTLAGGSPRLAVAVGAAEQRALLHDTGDTWLEFLYTVFAPHVDADGVSVPADALSLPEGATLRGLGGHDVDLSHPAQAFPGHRVNGPGLQPAVAVASDPAAFGWYAAGETITVTATFDRAVTVTGTPSIGLQVGDAVRRAGYTAGSDSAVLSFDWLVTAADHDADGVSVPADSLSLDGGAAIDRAAGFGPAFTGHAGIGPLAGHRVGQPAVTDLAIVSDPGLDGIYTAGERIEVAVTFNEPVQLLRGLVRLALAVGGAQRQALAVDRGGTATLTFAYVVIAADRDHDGVSVPAGSLLLDAGAILRGAGDRDALLAHEARAFPAHPVNAVAPFVAFTSTPANGHNYLAGRRSPRRRPSPPRSR